MTNKVQPSHASDFTPLEAVLHFFTGLPLKGPSLPSVTLRALAACGPLPPHPQVVDLGCGAGASTLVLAKALGVPITAVDFCATFLDELVAAAEAQGLAHLIRPLCRDFAALDIPEASVDLLWSEGAIYNVGWEQGLRAWAPLVKPGGHLAVTEAIWLTEHPPEPARKAWDAWCQGLETLSGRAETARRTGLEVVESFPLPAQAWDVFYAAVEVRLQALKGTDSPALRQVLQGIEEEIALYRAYGTSYGYGCFVLRT